MSFQIQNNDGANSPQDTPESFGGLKNFWLLRDLYQRMENSNATARDAATPEQMRPNSTPKSLPSTAGRNVEKELERPPSVRKMKQVLEANASAPIFPQNELATTKNVSSRSLSEVTSPVDQVAAQAGEMWSPEKELQSISIAKYKKNLESNNEKINTESVRSLTPAESIQSQLSAKESNKSSRSEDKKRSVRKKKKEKKLTPEDKMRNLSTECLSLSHRLKSLPKFSPEWTLSKMEMTLITDELEYLYEESMNQTMEAAPV